MKTKNDARTDKKKQNIQVNVLFYMMIVFVAGIIALGLCQMESNKDYKNVIVKKENNKMVVRDVRTNQERILVDVRAYNVCANDLDYLYSGDTVFVRTQESIYKKHKVMSNPIFKYNIDSVFARRQRAKFNLLKDSIFVEQTQNER